MKKIVGIDLGTTNSVVSYPTRKEDGSLSVDFLEINKSHLVPSFIYVGEGGRYVVGKAAKSKMNRDPERILSSYKPYMGSERTLKTIDGVGYNSFTSTSIALKYIKANIEKKFPEGIDGVVITVPAYFNENQKADTSRAAKSAGLDVKGIITEPSASAFCYIETHDIPEDGETVLVYDIGGGTFDVSIVYLAPGGFATVIGIGGDQYLGGDDFDEILAEYIEREYYPRSNFTGSNKQVLVRACERAKIELMKEENKDKEVYLDVSALDTSVNVNPVITYKKFKEITKTLVNNTLNITRGVLDKAVLTWDDIDDLLLVGGSSRLLNIREALEEETGGKYNLNREDPYQIAPDYSVSWGASVYADLIMHKETQKVTDILSKDFGIANNKGEMIVVLDQGSPVPISGTRAITNPMDDQERLTIGVYEGNNEHISHNTLIGSMVITLPEGIKAHELDAIIKFEINSDGILSVALMGDYEEEITIKLDRSFAALDDESETAIEEAEFSDHIDAPADVKEEEDELEEDPTIRSWGKLI